MMAIDVRFIRNYFIGDLHLEWVILPLHTKYGISLSLYGIKNTVRLIGIFIASDCCLLCYMDVDIVQVCDVGGTLHYVRV